MRAIVDAIGEAWSAFWNARNARERSLLALGIVTVVFGLLYVVGFAPALSGRRQLAQSLPELRQQVADMSGLAREAANLRNTPVPVVDAVSHETIDASLVKHGLKAQNVAVTDDIVRVQMASASFAATLEWLSEMQKSAHLSVMEADIAALDSVDQVRVTLTLKQQRGEEKT